MGGDLGRDALFSSVNLFDDVEKFFWSHIFQDVGTSAGFESALDFDIAFEGGQDDNASLGEFGANVFDGIDATLVGKAQIHEGDIREEFAKLSEAFLGTGGLANQNHSWTIVDQSGESIA